MQYTTNYNLNKPEGTDIVNPLTVDNPNWDSIDAGMYANKQNSVQVAQVALQETTIAITRDRSKPATFRFIATMNYATNMTITVDGTSVTATMPDGSALAANAFRIGSNVLCSLNGTALTIYTNPVIDVNAVKTAILQAVYPVGSIIINESPINPSEVFGFGTWERIQGQFIFGADATHALNTTGGVENTTLTQDNMPSHSHSYTYSDTPKPSYVTNSYQEGSNNYFVVGSTGVGGTTSASGNGTSFTNMPPYIAKYIWRRTA